MSFGRGERTTRLAFGLASRLAPKDERLWLREMSVEYAFVQGRRARLRWLFGMVGLALQLRAASLRLQTPQRLLLASLVSVLFVAIVVSPLTSPAPGEKTEAYGVESYEAESYEAEAYGAEAYETGTAEPTEADTGEALTPAAAAPAARATAPAPSTTPLQAKPAELTAKPEAAETATAEAAATTDAATADTPVAAAAQAPLAQTAPIVTTVASPVVTLRLTGTARLELRPGAADGPVLEEGAFHAGQTFSVTVPFYLRTSNAGAVTAQAGTEDLGRLGRVDETQARLFVQP